MARVDIKIDINPKPAVKINWNSRFSQKSKEYQSYLDNLRYLYKFNKIYFDTGILMGLTFIIPMPKSWSEAKKLALIGCPHTQKPDIDNLIKPIMDAGLENDCGVHTLIGPYKKIWGETGSIVFHY